MTSSVDTTAFDAELKHKTQDARHAETQALKRNDEELLNHFFCDRDDLRSNELDWKLILTSKEIADVVQRVANRLNQDFKDRSILLVCVLKGAAYFTVDLSRRLTIPHSLYFVEASSYQDSQTQSHRVELLSKLVPSKFVGKHVVLLDELYDNGATLKYAEDQLITEGKVDPESITTCTLFRKIKGENPSLSYPQPDIYGIDVPDCWLVGYGLDDKGEKRGWEHLFAVRKPKGAPLSSADECVFGTDESAYRILRSDLHAKSASHLDFC